MAEAAKEDEEQQAAEAEEVAAANRVWLLQTENVISFIYF
jgi:hypothetical protein